MMKKIFSGLIYFVLIILLLSICDMDVMADYDEQGSDKIAVSEVSETEIVETGT